LFSPLLHKRSAELRIDRRAIPQGSPGEKRQRTRDDPQVKRDLDRGAAESLTFKEAFKGKLAALVERSDAGTQLTAAVSYEGASWCDRMTIDQWFNC
jgi:hypothetical protein